MKYMQHTTSAIPDMLYRGMVIGKGIMQTMLALIILNIPWIIGHQVHLNAITCRSEYGQSDCRFSYPKHGMLNDDFVYSVSKQSKMNSSLHVKRIS
jgi:hypothetical protein